MVIIAIIGLVAIIGHQNSATGNLARMMKPAVMGYPGGAGAGAGAPAGGAAGGFASSGRANPVQPSLPQCPAICRACAN